MGITELQVLEARLLLAKADREWFHGRSFCDYRDEIEQSDRELNLAYNALVEFNKTDLERLEERVEDARVAVMAAEDAKESAEVSYTKRQSFYAKLNLELELLKELKPVKKVIDLSVLIESGIDCEFKDDISEHTTIGKLLEITNDDNYPYTTGNSADKYHGQCQPRMDHKHAWLGGECPLPEGFEIKVWYRGGGESVRPIASGNGLYWAWNYRPSDIIAFEVLGLADGYVMPWEQQDEGE